MCSEHNLDSELQTVKRVFIKNGSPGRLVDKVVEAEKEIPMRMATERKPACIPLSSESDTLAEVARRLTRTIIKIFYAVKPRIPFKSDLVVSPRLRDIFPDSTALCLFISYVPVG